MKNTISKVLTAFFVSLFTLSCTTKSEDSDFVTNADVIKSYAGKNYKLIAFETQIRYGNQLFTWTKGTRPNWLGNRYERQVTMDMKDVFDTTATFQLTNLGVSSGKLKWGNSADSTESYQSFDFIKVNGADQKSHTFFKAIYPVRKDGEFTQKSASIRYFPLTFPEKYRLKFSQDTLDVIYDNTKSALGAESMALRLKLIQ